MLGFTAFLFLEVYLAIAKPQVLVIVMYISFAILGIFYNNRQILDWNLTIAAVTFGMGGAMELAGASSGLWSYAFGERLPVFISFAWRWIFQKSSARFVFPR